MNDLFYEPQYLQRFTIWGGNNMNWKDYAFDVYYGREDCDDETNYLLEEMDEELEEL